VKRNSCSSTIILVRDTV